MKQLILQTGCDPFTGGPVPVTNGSRGGSLLGAIIRGCALINDTSIPVYVDIVESDTKGEEEATDSGAVLYIVAVLVFYSAGIVTMIVKYLKREKRELEEEKALEDFFRSMPAYKKEREQYKVNRVAIHAFHALTSLSYDDVDDDEVTSDDENCRIFAPTIHERNDNSDTNLDQDSTESTESEKTSDLNVFSASLNEAPVNVASPPTEVV